MVCCDAKAIDVGYIAFTFILDGSLHNGKLIIPESLKFAFPKVDEKMKYPLFSQSTLAIATRESSSITTFRKRENIISFWLSAIQQQPISRFPASRLW